MTLATLLISLNLLVPSAPMEAVQAPTPRVFVYLPTDIRPRAFQKLLGTNFTGVEVTVFGRVRDFQKNLKKNPPDAVLSYRPVLDTMSAVVTGYQGAVGAAVSESYVLLTVGKKIDITNPGTVIGVVDILGRKEMGKFVSTVLGVSNKLKLKRVTKTEDLLPLLQFSAADAILIPKSSVDGFRKKSKLELAVELESPTKVGFPAIGFLPKARKALIEGAVGKLPAQVNAIIGVKRWNRL